MVCLGRIIIKMTIHREVIASIYDLMERSIIMIMSIIITIIITITITREVTASIYDLMGHPGGERERSEAAEQYITRRADLLFQVTSDQSIW